MAASYPGGEGEGDVFAAPRGGSRGGKEGFGFGIGFGLLTEAAPSADLSLRRTGGIGGGCVVERLAMPVLNGKGGGDGFVTSPSAASTLSCPSCLSPCGRTCSVFASECGPLNSGVTLSAAATPPLEFIRFGGVPKVEGSRSVDNGRDT